MVLIIVSNTLYSYGESLSAAFLPELARKTARLLHHFRRIANDAQGRLRQELGPEFADLELSDLNPKAFVAKHLGPDAANDLTDVATELKGARTGIDTALHATGTRTADDDDREGDQVEVPAAATQRDTPFDPEST